MECPRPALDTDGRLLDSVDRCGRRKRNCRSLGCPGFPVESWGSGQLHVVLFRENHISGRRWSGEVGNPGTLGMTKGWVGVSSRNWFEGAPGLKCETWGTLRFHPSILQRPLALSFLSRVASASRPWGTLRLFTQRDEKYLPSSKNSPWKCLPSLCHTDPDFLPRSTGHCCVCAFLLWKGAHAQERGAQPRDLQFRGPLLEMFFDRRPRGQQCLYRDVICRSSAKSGQSRYFSQPHRP